MSYGKRSLLLLSLALATSASACGDESPATQGGNDDDSSDPAGEDAPDDTSDDGVDAGKKPVVDAGRDASRPVTANDAGEAKNDASSPVKTDAAAAPLDATVPTADAPRCVAKESQVMIIGDSYINWPTHSLPADLAKEAGQRGWRLEAVGGASMNSGGIAGFIPDQYTASQRSDKDVHTVIMDGSGNDVLIPDATIDPGQDCKNSDKSPTLAQCKRIVGDSQARLTKLFDQMAKDGVRDVVYFWYPHVPEGTLLGGAHPNVINDYAQPLIGGVCDGAAAQTAGKLRCHWVDMTPVFQGHDDWFFPGDIHPTSTGSAAMAKAIWSEMKQACVGQKQGSTCCSP